MLLSRKATKCLGLLCHSILLGTESLISLLSHRVHLVCELLTANGRGSYDVANTPQMGEQPCPGSIDSVNIISSLGILEISPQLLRVRMH